MYAADQDPSMNAAASSNADQPMRGATQTLFDILGDLRSGEAATSPQANEDDGPRATLGDVLNRLDERAYGFLLLLLALPCCLPFVYLLPQIVALPMLALAGQLAAGRRHPWLPKTLEKRDFQSQLRKVLVAQRALCGLGGKHRPPALPARHRPYRRAHRRRAFADPDCVHSFTLAFHQHDPGHRGRHRLHWPDRARWGLGHPGTADRVFMGRAFVVSRR